MKSGSVSSSRTSVQQEKQQQQRASPSARKSPAQRTSSSSSSSAARKVSADLIKQHGSHKAMLRLTQAQRAANNITRKVQLTRLANWKAEAQAYPCARTEGEAARTGRRRCVDFALFVARKRHPAALLVGNGPSASLVTDENARDVQQHFDVWATNMFFPHHYLTPDFHHVEVKGYVEQFWYEQFDDSVRRRYQAQCSLLWGMHEFEYGKIDPPTCAPREWRPGELRVSNMEAPAECYTNCP